MKKILESLFGIEASGSKPSTEILAGVTTFLTMAYIVVVQPAVLSSFPDGSPTGLDLGAVLLATCVVSGASTIMMGLVARYPVALAPGMGENFFFVSVIGSLAALGVADAWRVALGVVFVSGVLFLLLSVLPVRRILIEALGTSMRSAVAAGIGLFIAFIGLKNANVVVDHPGTLVTLTSDLVSIDVAVFLLGLVTTVALMSWRIPGAILWGLLASSLLAFLTGRVDVGTVVGLPRVEEHAAFALDIPGALTLTCLPFIVVFLFMDVLDTTGTLVAVAEQGGLMKDGKLPRAGRAMITDASGTVAGSLMGTSTVTSFIESTAGIAAGGRTGLASVVTGLLFFVALLFGPAIAGLGGYGPITAPALVVVGALMIGSVGRVEWKDPTEGLPAFLIIAGIPLTYSIADGLALGFVSYPVLKLLAGKARQVHWIMYVLAIALLLYFVLVRSRMG